MAQELLPQIDELKIRLGINPLLVDELQQTDVPFAEVLLRTRIQFFQPSQQLRRVIGQTGPGALKT